MARSGDFKSTIGDMAFATVLNKAAQDYKREVLAEANAKGKSHHDDLDMEELANDPELEKLHAERIASLKKEAEKRAVLRRSGHGEYRTVEEAEFLGEVTGSKLVVCHFFHAEFERCKIMDKHLRLLAPQYFDTKFIKVDAEKCPFFVQKLQIVVLPCVVLFRDGIAMDRIVGFDGLGKRDDFATSTLAGRLQRAGVIEKAKTKGGGDSEDEVAPTNLRGKMRSSADSDSD